MARFVILEHDHPFLHWDLMLECGDVLKTWRLLEPPVQGTVVAAESSFDHQLKYLDFEGPVGGGRGCVKRWDCGTYVGELPKQVRAGGRIDLEFSGAIVEGRALLAKQHEKNWTVEFN